MKQKLKICRLQQKVESGIFFSHLQPKSIPPPWPVFFKWPKWEIQKPSYFLAGKYCQNYLESIKLNFFHFYAKDVQNEKKSDLPYKIKFFFLSDFNVFGVKWSALVRLNARKKLEVNILILAKVMEKIKSEFFKFTAPPCESGFFEI